MSLTNILQVATSGLQVSQETMRYISANVTNINSPDYVRKVVHQEASTAGGQISGVKISSVQRSVDEYLEADRLRTISEYNRLKEFVDTSVEIQALFGDPSQNESLPGMIDQITAGFSELSVEPESLIRRFDTLQNLNTFGDELERVADRIQFIRSNVENRINDEVTAINEILDNLYNLNPEIAREEALGRDTSALQEQRSSLLQDLSEKIDIRTYEKSNGYMVVTTSTGQILVEDTKYELNYIPSPLTAPDSTFNPIQVYRVNPANGLLESPSTLEDTVTGGTLKGLLDMRDIELPQIAEQLGQLGMVIADQLNMVSNEHSAIPAPTLLQGRETGLLNQDALNFTGEAVFMVTNANREIVESIRVNFDTGTIDDGSGTPTEFAPRGMGNIEDFITAFNTESSNATLSFDPALGKMQLIADNQDNGVVIAQDSLTRSALKFSYDIAADSVAGRYGTGAADTDFTVTIGGDTVVTVADMTVNADDSGSVIADALNADSGFRDAGLTAYWVNNSTGGELVVEHVTNEALTNASLTNTTNSYSETPTYEDTTANPSVRGGRGTVMQFSDLTDDEINTSSGSINFSLDVDGTAVSVSGITATTLAELVDALNGDTNFRSANLTAFAYDNTLYVEHDDDATLDNQSLTGSTTSTAVSASVATMSDGSVVTNGRGFSHFFGMNDLMQTDTLPFRETGIVPSDPHRFKGSTLEFDLTDLAATGPAIDTAIAAATGNIDFTATIGGTTISVTNIAASTRDDVVAALNADTTFSDEGMVAYYDGTELRVESTATGAVTSVSLDFNGTTASVTNTKHGGDGGVVVFEVRGPNNELPAIVALNFSDQAYDFKNNFPNSYHSQEIEISVSGSGYYDMQSVIDALNNTTSGMGDYASFELDADGQLSYTMTTGTYSDFDVRVLDDTTARGTTSKGMTDLFGIGKAATMNGAFGVNVLDDIVSDPNTMSLSGIESYMTSTVASTLESNDYYAMNPGSTSGVVAMEAITRTSITFEAAGGMNSTTLNMSSYASSIIQQTSLNAAQAEQLAGHRESVLEELQRRWESVSAVNLDEELSNMITFQNSYSASARVITTVSQMFDTLLAI